MVVEVVLHALYLLIGLVSLSSDEDYVTLLCHHAGSLDGFASVSDGYHLLHLLGVQSCHHVVDDVLRLLEAWIVAGDYDAVALTYSLLRHERTLALVAVAACSAYCDDVSLSVEHFMDGVEHVLQSIGSVGMSTTAV